MKSIVFDSIIFYLQKRGGGSVYWYEITSRIFKRNVLQCEELVYRNKLVNFYDQFRNTLGIRKRYSIFSGTIASLLPSFSFKRNFIFHSGYYRFNIIRKLTNSINLITVYDFIPEKFLKGWVKYRAIYRKAVSLFFCDAIICISENTKNDLLYYYPFCKNKKIEVIYCGVSDDYFFKGDYNEKSKQILFVGSRISYKNFDLVLKVLSELKNYELIVVGDSLSKLEAEFVEKYKIRVRVVKNASNQELNDLYNQVTCLLYPSSYEGFGIPVIEAMKAGCPVIGYNASSVAEISNRCALLVDELDVSLFCEKVSLLENLEYRTQIVNKGLENAEQFSWEKAAIETEKFYLKLTK